MTQAKQPLSTFIEHRLSLDTYHSAIAAGLSDENYLALVARLDQEIAKVAGVGFRTTPMVELSTPLHRLVLAKVETGNVGGSHKARHLFGLLLQQVIQEQTSDAARDVPLAIASCGNAALGAAVVARATDRALQVFVPVDADPLVVTRLVALDAEVVTCHRQAGTDGDPCIQALQGALADGAHAFTVQGTMSPGAFDGARTLGLEMASQWHQGQHANNWPWPSDLYIQVGGGALGTAVCDGIARADLGPLPRLHPVQPATAHPFVATWRRLLPILLDTTDAADAADAADSTDAAPASAPAQAEALRAGAQSGQFDSIVEESDDLMTPWPTIPRSIATGILDDITYDWKPLTLHQLRSGGWPLLPTEQDFADAAALATSTVVPPPDATGAAGLAGALVDEVTVGDGPAAVILSGIDRAWEAHQLPHEAP